MTYLISYPEGFQKDQKYPLVMFLHGAGSRAKTPERLYKNVSSSFLLKRQNERGYILLAPHCNGINWDEWMPTLVRLVQCYREASYVDNTRIHLTGFSGVVKRVEAEAFPAGLAYNERIRLSYETLDTFRKEGRLGQTIVQMPWKGGMRGRYAFWLKEK